MTFRVLNRDAISNPDSSQLLDKILWLYLRSPLFWDKLASKTGSEVVDRPFLFEIGVSGLKLSPSTEGNRYPKKIDTEALGPRSW